MLLSGDFVTYTGPQTSSFAPGMNRAVVRAIDEFLGLLNIPVLYVPGNHDNRDLWSVKGNLISVDALGDHGPQVVEGVRIMGIGGSWSLGGFPYEWEDKGLATRLAGAWPAPDGCPEILLCHAPPADSGVDLTATGETVGSRVLRQIITARRPTLVICGHIHEGLGWGQVGNGIRIFNAGTATVLSPPRFVTSSMREFSPVRLRYPALFFTVHYLDPTKACNRMLAMLGVGNRWMRTEITIDLQC